MLKRISIVIVLAINFIASCKKYPEDHKISIESPESRMARKWDVTYFGINGYDSTSYLKNQQYYGKYAFYHDEYGGHTICLYDPNFLKGYWMLTNKKKYLFIHFDTYTSKSLGPYRANDITWEIRRLTNKELWLKTIYNTKEYFVKFKPEPL